MSRRIYLVDGVTYVVEGRRCLRVAVTLDDLFQDDDPAARLERSMETTGEPVGEAGWEDRIQAPIGGQEVWAAGVTYFRSRSARIEESQDAGGGDFYDRVYDADRPELFFKAMAARVSAPGRPVRIRSDSHWNVPEPELTLAISQRGTIFGYTIGNDVSSRDIEGANPLYLPQAKVYAGCCALGPGILMASNPLPPATPIQLVVRRAGRIAYEGATTLAQMKRTPEELAAYLYRDNIFPFGSFLMTGTGIVPGADFSLRSGDVITITIEAVGTLTNSVA